MQIKSMFDKQIDRDIKGVIKVGQSDEENIYQEVCANQYEQIMLGKSAYEGMEDEMITMKRE